MVERRKGIGYIIEALAALLVLFIFVIGNNPVEPATDWNDFQDQVMSQDITLVMEKSGDIDDFVRNGETGSTTTLAETLSDGRLSVSGSIENVPITTQVVGFHTLEDDRNNVTLSPVEEVADNQCYQDNDLEEIESEEGEIHRSKNAVDGSYLYVADTDPEISGGNDEIDYDSVWVDNRTRCQFSASEGPYYIGDFFYWGGEHYDFNQVYNGSSPKQLELFLSSQIQELRPELRSRMNGIETGTVVDTVAVERENLQAYDILVFRERQSLNDIEENRERIEEFMSDGSVLLMMELRREDFYEDLGGTSAPEENFITGTGLRWVNLEYAAKPSDPAGGNFNPNRQSGELETYFRGMEGDASQLNLRPSGNVTSSNSQNLKSSAALLSTGTGAYDRTEWNATNYEMNEVDPDSVEGEPKSECVGDTSSSALTQGEFDFHDYQSDSFVPYDVINIQLSDDPDTCDEDYVRAVEIDKDEDGDYDESDEGPFLDGEQVRVENKTFTVNFPTQDALETGDTVEFVYNGESDIESINYRTSFEEFEGERLARMEYKSNYGLEEKKMIAAVTHWLSEDNARFGDQRDAEISTEIVGGVKENTFIPYRVSLRWR